MPRASRQSAHSSNASNTSRQLKRSFSDINPYFTPSVAPSTPNEPPIARTQIANNFVGGKLLAHEELGTRSSNNKHVRFLEPHDATFSSVPPPQIADVSVAPASPSHGTPMIVPTPVSSGNSGGNNDLDPSATVGNSVHASNGPSTIPQAAFYSPASDTDDVSAAPILQLTPQQLVALQRLCQQMFGNAAAVVHQSSEAPAPVSMNTRSVSAAPTPQLTPQQLAALQQLNQQMFGNTPTVAHQSSEAPARISTNTRSQSLQPSTSARSQSLQPSTSAQLLDDNNTFSDSAEDSDDEPLGDKIPRPKGEVTRISRQGFNVSKQLIENGWSARDVDKLSKHIRSWVYRYLDAEKSYTLQKRDNIRQVKQMAKDKYPALEKFHNLWPVDAYIRSKLKYSNEAARSVEKGQKAARHSARLNRSNRGR